ncbi:MAG: endonuclease domain-containing protein, partial [Metallibacterium scheffleri]
MPSPVTELPDPRQARVFRFTGCDYAAGEARLRYAFDEGPALVERIRFPDAPVLAGARAESFQRALRLLHLIAGVSYYKAGVAPELRIEGAGVDAATLDLLRAVYTHGLAEFAYRNGLDLRGRMHWQVQPAAASAAPALGLP